MGRRGETAQYLVALCVLGLAMASGHAKDAFTKIQLEDAWLKTPKSTPAPEFEKATVPGVKAVFYEGVPLDGKPTRVFAYYGIPHVPDGQKVPAMVLIHGGGGTAFETWVQLWNKRGYAAIAMDTCGCVPRGSKPNSAFSNKWERLPDGGPPGWGGFEQMDRAPRDQWTYHAVSAAIIGHSLLRSFPEVDAERVGVTGISWGGYLTCIVAGLDTRFKFAVPVYGCGFLGENSAWSGGIKGMGEKGARWLQWWDPSVYLKDVAMPIMWVTGTNDFAYPMDSLQKCYRLPKSPVTLCIRVRMPHGHGGAGENPAEIHAFAESVLRGGKPLAGVSSVKQNGRGPLIVSYTSAVPVVKAELNFTKDSGKWQTRKWETIPAALDAKACDVRADVPADATVYYVNLIDERGLVVSTEHIGN